MSVRHLSRGGRGGVWQNAPVRLMEETATSPAAASRPALRRPRWVDVAVPLGYLVLAGFVLGRLWADPAGRVLTSNEDDHGVFLAFVAHGERVMFHGAHPLLAGQLNVPDGVNMMANTSILALTLPLAPVTHWFGAAVTVVLLLTLGLAGTAAAWYAMLARHVVRSRAAAAVGGLWCGFAPTMVSHANGHINFVSQFVVPFLVWRALRLREPGRAVRNGAALGALIVLQVFINEEILLFTALGLGVFVLAHAAWDRAAARAAWRPMLAGLAVAAGVSAVPLAYPLWFQFFGPGHYRGLPFSPGEFVTDLLAHGAYARRSIAGNEAIAQRLSFSATEDNAFFGLPLLIVLAVAGVLLWRSVAARATIVVGLVFVVFGLGPNLHVAGRNTGIPLPFWLVRHVPILDLVTVTRFTMIAAAVVGVVLALALDRMRAVGSARARLAFGAAVTAALLPVTPTPLPVRDAAPLPAFVADGLWRQYVPAGRAVVPVPLPEVTSGRSTMRWIGLTNLAFPVPRTYFMGPRRPPADLTGNWSAPARPTADLLNWATNTGRMPYIGPQQRAEARADLVFWRAAVVVLGEHPAEEVLRRTVTDLLGRQPQRVGDVWLWDVRDLT
jgi:hypothetical protein